MTFKLISTFWALTLIGALHSQSHLWSVRWGGEGVDRLIDLAMDNDGGIYGVGYATDSVWFDTTEGTDSLAVAQEAAVMLKLNDTGQTIWAGSLAGNGEAHFTAVTTTSDGGAAACGFFTDTLITPWADWLSSSERDGILVRLDPGGNLLWGLHFSGMGDDRILDIAIEQSGDIWLAGAFSDTLDADPGPAVFQLISAGGTDAFFIHLNQDGVFIDGYCIGGPDDDEATSVAKSSAGGVVIGGWYRGEANLQPASESTVLYNSSGVRDCFMMHLNSSGDQQWVRTFGGPADDLLYGLAVNDDGAIGVVGSFAQTMIFDTLQTGLNLSTSGGNDAYSALANSEGQFIWTRKFGGAGSDKGLGVALTQDSILTMSGTFSQTAFFGVAGDELSLSSSGSEDAFVLKMGNDGTLLWKRRAGRNDDDAAAAVVVDMVGDTWVAGYFEGNVAFNPGQKGSQLPSAGESDGFVWKIGQCETVYGAASHEICAPQAEFNGEDFTETGIYEQELFNPIGCDSLVTLTITFFPVDLSITLAGDSLTAWPESEEWQWIDCLNGFMPISEATGQVYFPEGLGSFAVTVTNGPCSETSECVTILSASTLSRQQARVFPNPASDVVRIIGIRDGHHSHRVDWIDISGRVVNAPFNAEERTFSVGHLQNGIYTLRILSGNEMQYFTVIIAN